MFGNNTFLSLNTVPTGVPQNVQVVSVSSTSIRISWEPPQSDQQNGVIYSYHLSITEVETGAVLSFKTVPTDNLFVVNSLHPFYLYNCSIAAFTIGLGPRQYVSVRTLPEGILSCTCTRSDMKDLSFSFRYNIFLFQ